MAISWIENVVNDHPTGTLEFQCTDESRRPRKKGTNTDIGKDQVVSFAPGEEQAYENLGIPWGAKQALFVTTRIPGQTAKSYKLAIWSEGAWDYIHVISIDPKNNKETEVATIDAGSMGDAPGVNHSAWELWFDHRGGLKLERKWRQGANRSGAIAIGVGVGMGVVAAFGVILGIVAAVITAGAAIPAVAAGVGGAVIGLAGPILAGGVGATVAGTVGGAALAITGTGFAIVSGVITLASLAVGGFLAVWSVVEGGDSSSVAISELGSAALPDVAAGKPATASSAYSPDFAPGKANAGGSTLLGGWASAAGDEKGFWQVDLGQPHSLNGIELTTRQDLDQPDTRKDFQIWASNHADMSQGRVILAAQGGEPGPFKGVFNVKVLDPTPYRYVAVVKQTKGPLFIARLRAFARPTDLAAGKPAKASSVYSSDFAPEKANDGGGIATGGWSPAGTGDKARFWQVDLGEPQSLSRIDLVTRQDLDQPETRQNFQIWASNHADMSQGHVVLGVQGPRPRPFKDVFTLDVVDPTPYRYIAAIKTTDEYFFISKLCAYGKR